MLNGIDVSYYQGVMDWQKAASRAQFAIIRAGSVNGVTGSCYWDYQWQNNKPAPATLPCGFYWYFRPNQSAVKQATCFLNLVRPVIQKGGKFTFPALYCDCEEPGQASVVREFCELVSKEFAIGIYTSAHKLSLLTGIKSWMKAYPLWMADWTPPYPVPSPWSEFLILQSGKYRPASDYGASLGTEIDFNIAQDNLVLPVVSPPPAPDYEARIKALEDEQDSIQEFADRTFQLASNLDKRVRELESR